MTDVIYLEPTSINLETRTQAVLYVCELAGQLSHGYWENPSMPPELHASTICVRPENLGCSFIHDRKIEFCNDLLVSIAGARMIDYVRKVNAFPHLWSQLGNHWEWEKIDSDDEAALRWVGVDSKEVCVLLAPQLAIYNIVSLRSDLKRVSEIIQMKQHGGSA